jgi:protein-disulfide isomerase
MDNNEDIKRFTLWFIVGVVLIGSFLALMFMNKGPEVTPGKLSKPASADEWIKGDKDAKVTLVEYSDFQCPACRAWEPRIESLMNEFGNHVRLVYRNFPLKTIHQNAQISAQAAEAAGMQGKYWEMHSLLFEKQSIWSPQTSVVVKETFASYAADLGLNVEQFKKDLVSDKAKSLVDEDSDSGKASGVDSTPTFFLNDLEIKPQNNDNFRQLLRDAVDASA